MSWIEAFRVQKILLENPGCCFPLGNCTAAFHTTALWHSCPLTFLWKCPGLSWWHCPAAWGCQLSALKVCFQSTGGGDLQSARDTMRWVVQRCSGTPSYPCQVLLQSGKSSWGFIKEMSCCWGAPLQVVKHKSQLDTWQKKTPYFCHHWRSPRIILLCTYQWKMEYFVTDAVYSRGTFLKYVK